MTNPTTLVKKEQTSSISNETKKGIENHKKTALHLEAAAKSHLEAAKHHEEENHDKAAKSTLSAIGHLKIAKESQKEVVKHSAANH